MSIRSIAAIQHSHKKAADYHDAQEYDEEASQNVGSVDVGIAAVQVDDQDEQRDRRGDAQQQSADSRAVILPSTTAAASGLIFDLFLFNNDLV